MPADVNAHIKDRITGSAEGDVIAELKVFRPTEIITPRRMALLIFLSRGWIGKGFRLYPPESLRRSVRARRNYQLGAGFNLRGGAQDWWVLISSGLARKATIHECQIGSFVVATDLGRKLLTLISPDVQAEARAMVRAQVWTLIRRRRLDRVDAAWLRTHPDAARRPQAASFA